MIFIYSYAAQEGLICSRYFFVSRVYAAYFNHGVNTILRLS